MKYLMAVILALITSTSLFAQCPANTACGLSPQFRYATAQAAIYANLNAVTVYPSYSYPAYYYSLYQPAAPVSQCGIPAVSLAGGYGFFAQQRLLIRRR